MPIECRLMSRSSLRVTLTLSTLATLAASTACTQADTAQYSAPIANIGGVDELELTAGNNNNVVFDYEAGFVDVTPESGAVLTGLDSGDTPAEGAIFVRNVGTNSLSIAHESGSSSAQNRIQTPLGVAWTLHPGRAVMLQLHSSRWRTYVLAEPAGGSVTTSTPSRSLGAAFQPSATRATMGYYSARIVSTITLSGGQAGRVDLLSDSANPPTTVRARCAGGVTGTVVVGISVSDTVECPMSYLVPAGHFVLLQDVDESGTPTQTITTQAEQVL